MICQVVSITHEQSTICSKSHLDGTLHEQKHSFAGHVVVCQPMKRKEEMHRMLFGVGYLLSKFLRLFISPKPTMLANLASNIADAN